MMTDLQKFIDDFTTDFNQTVTYNKEVFKIVQQLLGIEGI